MSDDPPRVTAFPYSRSGVARRSGPIRDLGLSALSRQIGSAGRNPKGHWCSRCQGIWWSYFLEAECPACGNRHG